VEAAGRQGAAGLAPLENRAGTAATAMSRAERSMVGSIERATAAMRSGGKAGADYYEMLAKQRGLSGDVLTPYINQLRQAEAAQKRLNQSGESAMSDRARTAALRGVPAQFTDILVSLQGGQNPLTVLLQQGGQLKDMFGGAGEAAKALSGYVLGLVNPFTLAAAAAGALAYGYYSGAKEAHAFLVMLQQTGNQAGASTQQLVDMSAAMDDLAGITQAKAAEALLVFASASGVGVERLQRYTVTAIGWERATGQSIESVAKEFQKLGDDPVKAVLDLNKQMGFLTSTTFEQIKSLQEVGRETDAARVAQDAYESAIATATNTISANLGIVERAWISIRDVGAEVIDMLKSIGRQEGMHAVVDRLQKELADKEQQGPKNDLPGVVGSWEKGKRALAERLENAKGMLGLVDSVGKAVKDAQDREKAQIDLSVEASKYYDKATQRRLALAAAEAKYGEASKTSAEAAKQYKMVIAGIEEKYKEKGGSTSVGSRRLDLSEIQNAAREEVAILDQKQRALDLSRQAGLMAEQTYYTQKRALVVESGEVEERALREQIARLESEKAKGAEALQVQKQLSDTKAKLALKEVEVKNKVNAVDQDAALAAERQKNALDALTATHQRYLAQLDQQQERTISTAWMGDKAGGSSVPAKRGRTTRTRPPMWQGRPPTCSPVLSKAWRMP